MLSVNPDVAKAEDAADCHVVYATIGEIHDP
jgi:hypothetical protein